MTMTLPQIFQFNSISKRIALLIGFTVSGWLFLELGNTLLWHSLNQMFQEVETDTAPSIKVLSSVQQDLADMRVRVAVATNQLGGGSGSNGNSIHAPYREAIALLDHIQHQLEQYANTLVSTQKDKEISQLELYVFSRYRRTIEQLYGLYEKNNASLLAADIHYWIDQRNQLGGELSGLVHEHTAYLNQRMLDNSHSANVAYQRVLLSQVLLLGIGLFTYLWLSGWLYRGIVVKLRRATRHVQQSVIHLDQNVSRISHIEATGLDDLKQFFDAYNQLVDHLQQAAQDALVREEKYRAIADYGHDIQFWLDPSGKLVWINGAAGRLIGYSAEECLALPSFPASVASVACQEEVSKSIGHMLEGDFQQIYEFEILRRDGGTWWASISWHPIYSSNGGYLGIRASIHDTSTSKQDRMALQQAVVDLEKMHSLNEIYLAQGKMERARLTSLLGSMRMGVLFIDNSNVVVYCNPAFTHLWGIDPSVSLVGQTLADVFEAAQNKPDKYTLDAHVAARDSLVLLDVYPGDITLKDNRILSQHCHTVQDGDGFFIGMLWVYEDVTKEHQHSERLVFLAERDLLTGLYNRYAFQEKVKDLVEEIDVKQTGSLALFYFDLDEFKYINDTHGHTAGDTVLKQVASAVSGQLRGEFFARIGGDEFALCLLNRPESELRLLAERLVQTVSDLSITLEGVSQPMHISSSVGVAIYPQHATGTQDLIGHVDTALYQAKNGGKNTWRMYESTQDYSHEIEERRLWTERIRYALDHDGFVLYCQGIHYADSQEIEHLEALIRMRSQDSLEKLVPPGMFIPIAEKTGLILELDRWVINRSIQMLAQYPNLAPIAINISGRSFDQADLPRYIEKVLHDNGVNPKRLMVELTETAAVSDMDDAQKFIAQLNDIGCEVCLDDFGAGFSSFAYLKHLQVQVLKIDGVFIRDLVDNYDSQVFVRGIASIAKSLGKRTVAEFVEDEAALRMLIGFGVDCVQGYHLSKPAPVESYFNWRPPTAKKAVGF